MDDLTERHFLMDAQQANAASGAVPFWWDGGRDGLSVSWPSSGATRPLFRPAPRSAMVFPLVVIVAVLPGLAALNAWDLTPPGPLWGLRGLSVMEGMTLDQFPAAASIGPAQEAMAFRAVAAQPPLYAWLEAFLFWLSGDRDPRASVLPSYIAGVLSVVLVYLHGRLWRGGGLGLMAALFVGFNQNLLLRMQESTPSTLTLCGVLATLAVYGWYARVTLESGRPWPWAGPGWCALCGGALLGISLLSLGGVALCVLPIITLHQYYLRADVGREQPSGRVRRWWQVGRERPGWVDGLFALTIGLAISLPWFAMMIGRHGWSVIGLLTAPSNPFLPGRDATLLSRLIELMPATLPLGLYGLIRAIRVALADDRNVRESVGGSFWVIWTVIASLLPWIWPGGPQDAFDLLLLVPLSLLAAQTIADLVNRRVPVRVLVWLAPLTAISVAWWSSRNLQNALDDVVHGHAEAGTALGLHLALDLVVVSIWLIRRIELWARRRDDRRRMVLSVFLVLVLLVTAVDGLREVVFRHGMDRDLLALRTMILRRNREIPFRFVAVVSTPSAATVRGWSVPAMEGPSPGGRLRFILRTALPDVAQRDLTSVDELFSLPEGQRLVIFAGTEQRLSYPDQSRLGLEAIHPGRTGILDAYATAQGRPTRR